MQANPHIAIVGCGFSGTSAFHQLVERLPAGELSVFEASGDFGPGYAYRSEECPDYLINNTTDSMCLTPASGRAFIEWLETRPDLVPNVDPKGHLPRRLYGLFLQDAWRTARKKAIAKGIKVNSFPFEVIDIDEAADGRVRLAWAEGELWADKVILTTGRCPDNSPVETPPTDSKAIYLPTHIMNTDLDALPLDATIHVLGASLSAYDVANRLFSETTGCQFLRASDGRLEYHAGRNQRQLRLCSRSGRLKAMQSRVPLALQRSRFTADTLREVATERSLRLQDIADYIRFEAKAHKAAIDWRDIAEPYADCSDAAEVSKRAASWLASAVENGRKGEEANFLVEMFEDAQIELWDVFAEQLLSAEDERRYRSEFETAALSYMAPCPIPTGEKLLALQEAGVLKIIKGTKPARLAADGSYFELEHDFGKERATVLINTTGSIDRNVTSDAQPQYIRNLVRRGRLRSYSRDGETLQGASVDMDSYLASGAHSIYVANTLLWGPGIFTSSARMMARVVACIVDDLMLKLE